MPRLRAATSVQAVIAAACLAVGPGAAALGQDGGPRRAGPAADRDADLDAVLERLQTDRFYFDLPAQPLADALRAFSQVTGIPVVADAAVVSGLRAAPTAGWRPARAALDHLLSDAPLQARRVDGGFVVSRRVDAPVSTVRTPVVAAPDDPVGPPREVITVSGVRAALADALRVKAGRAQFVDLVTADDVNDRPDQNVAEAALRLPGVAVTRNNGEAEAISIRGLPPTYTRVEINGRPVSVTIDSANPERAAVLSVFSADLFQTVEVVKSPSARDADGGLGGTVRLTTPMPLSIGRDFGGRAAVVSGERRDDEDFAGHGFFSETWLDGRIGLFGSAAVETRDRRADKVENPNGWAPLDPAVIGPDASPALAGAFAPERLRLENRFGDSATVNASLLTQVALDDLEFVGDVFIARESRDQNQSRLEFDFRDVDAVQLVSGAEGDDGRSLTQGVFVGNNSDLNMFERDSDILNWGGAGRVRAEAGRWAGTARAAFARSEEDRTQDRARARVGAAQSLGAGGGPVLTTSYDAGSDPTFPTIAADVVDLAPGALALRSLDRERRIIRVDDATVEAELERGLRRGAWTSVAVGGRWARSDISRRQGAVAAPVTAAGAPITFADGEAGFFSAPFGFGDGGAGSVSAWPSIRPSSLLATIDDGPITDFNDKNFYDLDETTWAAYAIAAFDATAAGVTARGDVGVRGVVTERGGSGRITVDDATDLGLSTDADARHAAVLPSANMVFSTEAAPALLVRFAAGRSLTRPTLEEVRPTVEVFTDEGVIRRGAPDLDPFLATSVDLGAEWYVAAESLIAATVFFKDIENFIADDVTQGTFDAPGLDPDRVYRIESFRNAGRARILGLELAGQAPFTALPTPFDRFGAAFNYTYADSSVDEDAAARYPFPGRAENSLNLIGYYEVPAFSARLAYHYRDAYLLEPAADDFDGDGAAEANRIEVEAEGRLDLALRRRFPGGFYLAADVFNLTGTQQYQYYDTPERIRRLQTEGRVIQVGVGYRFGG